MSLKGMPQEIMLSEGSAAPKRVQILRTGTFFHPKAGKVQITESHLDSLVKNFSENVRKIKLAVDYKHENEDKAAAWFENVEREGGNLFAEVKWTPAGQKVVADEEFKYVSPEFHLDYEDSETKKKYGPTLLGAGLTNRPFLKGMQALQLSEGDCQMTELEQANAKIAELEAKLAEQKPVQMSEEDSAKLLKFSELEAENATLKAEKEEAAKVLALSEKNKSFDALLSAGKAVEAQREHFISGDVVKFSEAFVPVKTERLGENENVNAATGDEKLSALDADKKILSLAEEKVKADASLDKGKAISLVLSENPALAKARTNK